MFTIKSIEAAHSKIKSGAEFPKYIQALKRMGVQKFETWVMDSHSVYFGDNNFKISSPGQYKKIKISDQPNAALFKHYLKVHQQGQTDYQTFCIDCAETGVEKWLVDTNEMTCIYFDKKGQSILVEQIPALG